MTLQPGPRPSDRFIPWYITSFFVVQFALFGWFYHVASSSYTGVVTDQAYEKGLHYNQTIAKVRQQEQLGWSAVMARNGGAIEFILHDRAHKPLTGAIVSLWLIRPVHGGEDQQQEMKEVKPGVYSAIPAAPEKGLWEVRIEARKDGHSYQISRRMEF
jgi:nitrogen fixation protein FixH